MNTIGIEIGGTKLQILLVDQTGKILQRLKHKVDADSGAEGIRKQIERFLTQLKNEYDVKAIGVGFGGPVDTETGSVVESFHIAGWTGFNMKQWLQSLIDVPVFFDNDANVAALAEARIGAGKNFRRVFYITLGSGVGSGFVIDGKLYHGAVGAEMEFGHIRINREGNFVEEHCSGWSVDKRIRESVRMHPGSILAEMIRQDPGNEARHLKQAIESNDETATRIFKETIDTLSFALSHVVHLLGPDLIIIGGGFSLLGEIICDEIKDQLPKHLMKVFKPGPDVRLAALKEDAVPLGAIELIKIH
jgi:glucokinase